MMTDCRYLLCLEREDLLISLRGITEIVSTNIASLLTPDMSGV